MTAPAAPPRLTFGRHQRLKQARDFSRARQHGRRLVSGCLIANWLVLPPGSPARLGVITTKKLGNAVVGARARRLLREAFRLHQHDLNRPVDLVLVAQRGILEQDYAIVERDFLAALRRAGLLRSL